MNSVNINVDMKLNTSGGLKKLEAIRCTRIRCNY